MIYKLLNDILKTINLVGGITCELEVVSVRIWLPYIHHKKALPT